jgi:hypothetical protein
VKQVIITNEAERQAALKRSQELTDRILDESQQREVEAIAAALEAYDIEHASVSGMNEDSK